MRSVLLILVCLLCSVVSAGAARYGVARTAAPVLNVPHFSQIFGGTDGKTLKTDRCGQVRELEFIALPGTVFSIGAEVRDGTNVVFRVESDDYPVSQGKLLYVDSRFVELREERPLPRQRRVLSRPDILASLKAAIGAPYVWGGNVPGGVDALFELFYGGRAQGAAGRHLALAGLDCSGLLYHATGGGTPRNTPQLAVFGAGVNISGKSAAEIASMMEPLDLIVWDGHVVIVLDRETVIESRLVCGTKGNGGVMTSPLRQRLAGIMRSRGPVNVLPAAGKRRDVFVVRRWLVSRDGGAP